MDIHITPSWHPYLEKEFEKAYFKELRLFIDNEYASGVCFPPKHQIFAAFDHSPFESVKVVIIGQDPYHGPGQANGLCFSVNDGMPFPPSLQNIFKELVSDRNIPIPNSGNLERWAEQGVLLLNATLTVRAGEAGSHQNRGWEVFTDAVIQQISKHSEKVVFMLWGGYAKKKGAKIDRNKHLVIEAGHPSPLSANRGLWFGNQHFSTANEYLHQNGMAPIQW